MNFTVPQFIEEETKIIGPLSFRQIVFIAIAIGISTIAYFSVSNFFIFILITAVSLGIGTSLALLKINKTPLPILIKNFFLFSFKPKIYLWQKSREKEVSSIKKELIKKDISKDKKPPISLSKRSRIQDLSIEISSKK
ncbi:MAG: PrgI family protein [Candidatus Paceibacterota bacterium]|jgi:hypothetical protein|nr:PrgI family protein [Candidatus Paceibacterota bacterium]MDD4467233.1 PrgI family protein [Candidatus Paceibacterota bacterium]